MWRGTAPPARGRPDVARAGGRSGARCHDAGGGGFTDRSKGRELSRRWPTPAVITTPHPETSSRRWPARCGPLRHPAVTPPPARARAASAHATAGLSTRRAPSDGTVARCAVTSRCHRCWGPVRHGGLPMVAAHDAGARGEGARSRRKPYVK